MIEYKWNGLQRHAERAIDVAARKIARLWKIPTPPVSRLRADPLLQDRHLDLAARFTEFLAGGNLELRHLH
jgi:hypothetical protein